MKRGLLLQHKAMLSTTASGTMTCTIRRCGSLNDAAGRLVPPAEIYSASTYRLPLARAFRLIEKRARLSAAVASLGERFSVDNCADAGLSAQHNEAERYAAYHCHHMLNAFRLERKLWTKKCTAVAAGPHCSQSNGGNSGLSVRDLVRVIEYVFYSSVLLHLTALYETSDKYCEALIHTILSCTIFLSRDIGKLNHSSELTPLHAISTSLLHSTSPAQAASEEGRHEGVGCWNSLRWAVVHYSRGISHWGLLDHTEPLLDMGRTEAPFRRMVQVFAQLMQGLLEDEPLSKEESDFLTFAVTREGCKKWLTPARTTKSSGGFPDGGPNCIATSTTPQETEPLDDQCLAQQRRLQLLPLLWLAMLGRHFIAQNKSGGDMVHARFALLQVLPLFAMEGKGDAPLALLARCFYFSRNFTMRASAADMGVLLARMEQHGVFSLRYSYSGILRAWMDQRTAQEPSPLALNLHKAYAAFYHVPLSALEPFCDDRAWVSRGEEFVRELLLRSLVQWSSCLNSQLSFGREAVQILRAARHVARLLDKARSQSWNGSQPSTTVSHAAEAVLRALATRLSCLSAKEDPSSLHDVGSYLTEFDHIVAQSLQQPAEKPSVGSVPLVYECARV
uniref:Uncharacterized protein n=1 Tax=Trypanosoma vivax (strain Y486) TaxID=1055687 RepID=G0U978_TRYVY|nr:conserved hypothetical protein [Trypanosoma vivax Y486]